MYKACVGTGAGGGGACHPRILADWLTLFKPGGQITTWHLQLQNPNTALYIVWIFIFWWLVRLYYHFPLSENESWSYLPTKYVTFHKIHSKQTRQFTNSAMAQLGRRQSKCLKAKEIYFLSVVWPSNGTTEVQTNKQTN